MSGVYFNSSGGFQHNSLALQEERFCRLGELIAASVVQGGSSLHIFNSSIFNYITGKDMASITPKLVDVSDYEVRTVLEKVQNTADDQSLRAIVLENATLFIDSGYTTPLPFVKITDKDILLRSVLLHMVLFNVKAEIDQFCRGLKSLGVLDAMQANPHLFASYFCLDGIEQLTADTFRIMFTDVKYSDLGSNARAVEEQAYMYFVDFLEECETGYFLGGQNAQDDEDVEKCIYRSIMSDGPYTSFLYAGTVTLPTILSFFTGADTIPPLGFPHPPTLYFSPENPYPTVSTCAIQLTLPTKHESYDSFKKAMSYGLLNHGGFALH